VNDELILNRGLECRTKRAAGSNPPTILHTDCVTYSLEMSCFWMRTFQEIGN
jgi:hypothetical protein